MSLTKLALAMGVVGVLGAPGAVFAQAPTEAPLEAPKNVTAEPSTPASRTLSTQAADAEIGGNSQRALALAERAISADPRDPWGHYNKAAALTMLGRTDEAVASFAAAEERYAASDLWGRSVAIYGGAHALAQAGRCEEARREFLRYAAFVRERDPRSADMATSYASSCRAPAQVPSTTNPTTNPSTK